MKIRAALGSSILFAQVVMIVVARFHPMRYYCWAPYDSQNEYEIHAEIGARQLTREQIEKRYRLKTPAVNPRAIYQVTDVVSYVERVYHPADDAHVTVTYRTNGGPKKQWRWPES
jgi:hypothetical protein